jgi:hypothetical protein
MLFWSLAAIQLAKWIEVQVLVMYVESAVRKGGLWKGFTGKTHRYLVTQTLPFLATVNAIPQNIISINLSKTKRNLIYVRNQSLPRCKHFPLQLKKNN